jgi:hypothetical protein
VGNRRLAQAGFQIFIGGFLIWLVVQLARSGFLDVALVFPIWFGFALWWSERPTVLFASSARLEGRVRMLYSAGIGAVIAAIAILGLGLVLDLMGFFHGLSPRSPRVAAFLLPAVASAVVGIALYIIARSRPRAIEDCPPVFSL